MQQQISFGLRQYMFISLASGSSGNCYFVGNSQRGVLLDAGIGYRTIKKALGRFGIPMHSILGVVLTHDHVDHIRGLEALITKQAIPVYATETLHHSLLQHTFVPSYASALRHTIQKEVPFAIAEFIFTPFDVIHDSSDNSGFHIAIGNTYSCTLATDVGTITNTIKTYARKANHLIIESNYDEQMLHNGHYPKPLKERITSGRGHLSNRQTANFLKEIYTPHLQEIWLCHLSADNNTPERAYQTIQEALESVGASISKNLKLQVLLRGKPSPAKEF